MTTSALAIRQNCSFGSNADRSLLNGILAYDHPELVERLRRELSLSADKAQELFQDTKKYLYVCATADRRLAPTPKIDAGWHEFLLYTGNYASFCNRFFGRFVHHTPAPTLSPHVPHDPRDTIDFAREIVGNLGSNWEWDGAIVGSDCGWDGY